MAGIKYDISVGIQQALQSLDQFGSKLQKVSSDFEGMSSKIGAGAAAIGAALVGLGASAAAFADELADVAAANETTVASILGLGAALQSAGGQSDTTGRLLQSLSNNMEAANSGNLKMVSTFEKLGISISDLGQLSQDEIRNKMIKSLAEMTDVTERNALAQQMFGKAALGVDWKKVAADIDENTQKYAEYEQSLKTAGDAFDSMASLIKDLKVAAAQAFEPIFKYIAKLHIDIPTLTTFVKILGAAFVFLGSAAVLAGIGKLVSIMKDLNSVVSKNKLITIIGLLVSAGVAGASWLGLMKDTEEAVNDVAKAQEGSNQKTEKTKRDQSGIYEAIKKQKDALSQVTESYNRQIKNIQDKIAFENEALLLSDEQKKIKQEQNAIETQTLNALASLKQKYDGMDIDARKRVQGEYEKEKKAITENGEAAKKAVEQQISSTEKLKNVYKDLLDSSNTWSDVSVQLFDQFTKTIGMNNKSLEDRIALETQLTEITKLRSTLMSATAGLSDKEKSKAIDVITMATTQSGLMTKGYKEVNTEIENYIRIMGEQGVISQETANKILENTQNQRKAISDSAGWIASEMQSQMQYQREFSTGWAKAFREYSDNATNAARQAEQIFNRITSSMEDMLMGFFKTGKLGWRDFLQSVIDQLMRSQIQQLIAKTFGGMGGTGKGGLLGGALIPGFLAEGGPANANKPYIVGERGPELFVPNTSGTVVPNNALGGTNASNITYNINAVDAMSFKQMIAADPSFLFAVTEQGRRKVPGAR